MIFYCRILNNFCTKNVKYATEKMGSFIELPAEISSKDENIVKLANFCCKLHIQIGCENQECNNLHDLVQELINIAKRIISFEEKKNLFANCCYNHRDLIQPLFLFFKYEDYFFELVNIIFDFFSVKK